MSISRRTAVAVRTLGVASATAVITLGFAGSAFACQIGDFKPSVACNTTNGTATITVVDDDSSASTAEVQLFDGTTSISPVKTVVGGPKSSPGEVTFDSVTWKSSGSWTLQVNVKGRITDQTVNIPATGAACVAATSASPSPSATKTVKPTSPASASASSSKGASPSASAPASGAVDATASASPSGPALAETGGGSDSGMIAGIAGALVLAGGGSIFALRRRGAAGRH